MESSLVFDIARGSFVDGPGIRSVVFLKGCPLRCKWCHNPESHLPFAEIQRDDKSCIMCKECMMICENNAISFDDEFKLDSEKCDCCGLCVEACNTNSIKQLGKYYSPQKLFEILIKDKNLYANSGGGITFSGGEPLMHIEYLANICKLLKRERVNIAVQTCGFFNFENFARHIQKFIDIIYFDIKLIDSKKHKAFTFQSNGLILQNLKLLLNPKMQKIIVRTPLIPGKTDTESNLRDIREHIKFMDIDAYETLNYNPI